MPYSCPRFVFHYKNHFYLKSNDEKSDLVPDAILNGHSSSFREYSVKGDFGLVGVNLYPYAPNVLFNLRGREFFNQTLSLNSILSDSTFNLLQKKLYNCISNEDRINTLSDFLIEQFSKKSQKLERHNEMIKQIVMAGAPNVIGQASAQYGFSVKQIERKFIAEIGLTPKLFSRIVRFQDSLTQIQQYEKLTNLALDAGYYDQAHFIHEFKYFSGLSPSSFVGTGAKTIADVVCQLF